MSRRRYFLLILFAFLLSRGAFADAYSGIIDVRIDGRALSLDQPAVMMNGIIMVPLRAVAENLGAEVSYDPNLQTWTVTRGERQMLVTIGSDIVFVDGLSYPMNAVPLLQGGRVLVPLAIIQEGLGADAVWRSDTHTVDFSSRTGGVDLPVDPRMNNPSTSAIYPSDERTLSIQLQGIHADAVLMNFGTDELVFTQVAPGLYAGSIRLPSDFEGKDFDLTIHVKSEK